MKDYLTEAKVQAIELLKELERKVVEQLDPDEEFNYSDYESPVLKIYAEFVTILERFESRVQRNIRQPLHDPVEEARLLRADIERRTIKGGNNANR